MTAAGMDGKPCWDGGPAAEAVGDDGHGAGGAAAEEQWQFERSSGMWYQPSSGMRYSHVNRSYWKWDAPSRGFVPVDDNPT